MARHGVDFETVKQAALKLLSKGISPSVQRIRELLGTGSNSTIAEHLKVWREQHAAKKVHHLPASIPEELINTFETLWQTAMEHAERHLIDVKEALESQEEKLNQEKIISDKAIADLKALYDAVNQKLDEKIRENQTLQTNIAVTNERCQNQANEIGILKQQHELRLKHVNDEKHQLIDEVNKLHTEIVQYKKDLSFQAEKYQTTIANERALQEESEKRWMKFIDQAKLETKNLQKKYDEDMHKQNDKIDVLQNNLMKLQNDCSTTKTTVNHKNSMIENLTKELEQQQNKNTMLVGELAVLKSKLNAVERNKCNEKLAEAV